MKKGFTIIELLVTIIVLGILYLIVTPLVSRYVNSSTVSLNKSKIASIIKSANNYYTEFQIDEKNKFNGATNVIDYLELNGDLSKFDKKEVFINNNGEIALAFSIKINNDNYCYHKDFQEDTYSVEKNYKICTHEKQYKIYGLSWDSENDTYERLEDAIGLTANIGIDSEKVVNDFDNAEIYSEIKDVKVDGNEFVKIPKFYIKKIVDGNTWKWYISKKKQDDNYYLPLCFYDLENNKELDYVLVGKYNANLNGTKLSSQKGKVPLSYTELSQYRTYLNNNETGYQLFDFHTLDVIQVLFYIEFKTLNSQNIMKGYTDGVGFGNAQVVSTSGNTITITSGKGQFFKVGQLINVYKTIEGLPDCKTNLLITSISGDTITYTTTDGSVSYSNIASNYYVGNTAYINGATDDVVATSGVLTNNEGEYPMKYRGIENLYGNLYQIIDGIYFNTTDKKIYANNNPLTYNNYDSTDYYLMGYERGSATSNYYYKKMGFDSLHPFLQIPTEYGASATTYYGDYFISSVITVSGITNNKTFILMGGPWNAKSWGGLSFYEVNSCSPALNVGTRIVKKPL